MRGAIYLYETDQRMRIPITMDHREAIQKIVEAIRSMTVENIPPLVDNPNKRDGC